MDWNSFIDTTTAKAQERKGRYPAELYRAVEVLHFAKRISLKQIAEQLIATPEWSHVKFATMHTAIWRHCRKLGMKPERKPRKLTHRTTNGL
jgi:hypothetical protein